MSLITCPRCGETYGVGYFPFCPHDRTKRVSVIGDEVDYVDHNLGPEPIHITSMAQRARIMKERGLVEHIRHVPVPGTDHSPHTTDWSKGSIDPYTLAAAAVLVTRGGGRAVEPEEGKPAPVANAFSHVATTEEVRALARALKDGG